MPCNIYTRKVLIPEDKEIIYDNEKFFATHKIKYEGEAKEIIREIERGECLDKYKFYDRFGIALYTSFLSTGSKTLLNITSYLEYVFCADEMGVNAIREFVYLQKGSIYFKSPRHDLPELLVGVNKQQSVYINSRLYEDWEEIDCVF